ncbi:helix-turn-helix domain-containing protein [Halobacillus seohaensis]|uniref:Helix-turn-helix domain-containing protein n=1 Tax=Halobacillus seohaensis TaxID=447421 RepID=A0ABW2EPA2_9BACI
MNYVTTDLKELAEHVTFASKVEMDEKIYEYLARLQADEQPDSVIEVLRFFGRSSLRLLGVSFAKYQTIADSVGISKSTVIRAVKRLVEFGMIDKLPTVKKWRGKSRKKSVNVIRILPTLSNMITQDDNAIEDVESAPSKASGNEIISEPSNFNHTQKHVLDTTDTLKHAIPKKLYEVMSPFFNVEGLYETIGALYRAKATVDPTIQAENHPEYIEAFLSCVRRYKDGKVRNLLSYLYTTWRKVSRGIYLKRMADVY